MSDMIRRARTPGGHNPHPGAGAAKQLQHRCLTCSSGRGRGVPLEWELRKTFWMPIFSILQQSPWAIPSRLLGGVTRGALGTGAAPGHAQVLKLLPRTGPCPAQVLEWRRSSFVGGRFSNTRNPSLTAKSQARSATNSVSLGLLSPGAGFPGDKRTGHLFGKACVR